MLKRTYVLGLLLGGAIAMVVVWSLQVESRPFTAPQLVLLFLVSCLPGFGLALLGDPFSRSKKEEYLKVDFYREDD